MTTETPDIPLPSSAEIAKGKKALQSLLNLLLTSNQLRSLLFSSLNLFRDLFSDSADQITEMALKTAKISKKVANKSKNQSIDSLEKEFVSEGDLKKKTVRGVEDLVDEVAKGYKESKRQVSFIPLVTGLTM